MPNVIDRSRAEALIREQVVSTIFQDAPKQSVVMQLGRKLPNMTSKQTRIPVLSMLPLAYWVNGTSTVETFRWIDKVRIRRAGAQPCCLRFHQPQHLLRRCF